MTILQDKFTKKVWGMEEWIDSSQNKRYYIYEIELKCLIILIEEYDTIRKILMLKIFADIG